MNTFSKKEAFHAGWQRFKKRPLFIIGLFIITTLVSVTMSSIIKKMDTGGVKIAVNILDFTIQIILGMGLVRILLNLHDEVDTHYIDFFEPIRMFFKYLVMTIMIMIMIMTGLLFFIVPGIILMIALMFAPYAMIDKNLGPIEAIKESMKMTKGHRWNLFIFIFLIILLNIAGALFIGIGLFITIPVTTLAAVHVYRWVNDPEGKEGVVI